MAMNTTVNTGNVKPIEHSTPTLKNGDRIVTSGESPSFQPETQVDLHNSMKSLLGALEKTALGKGVSAQALPEEVQKMVVAMLKDAFSLDASLGKGLANVLQNQRLTLDQLSTLAKFLEQAGAFVESGQAEQFSDALKVLLSNIKFTADIGERVLNGTALNQLALQLLEGKNPEDFAALLQFLTMQPPGAAAQGNNQPAGGMQFLKQLIQYFMPNHSEEGQPLQQGPQTGQTEQTGQTNQQGQTGQSGQTNQQGQTRQSGQTNQPGQTGQTGQTNQPGQMGQSGQTNQPGQTGQAGQTSQQGQSAQTANAAQPQGNKMTPNPAPTGSNLGQSANSSAPQPNGNTAAVPFGQNAAAAQGGEQARRQGTSGQTQKQRAASPASQGSAPLQNTAQTMRLLKEMAGQLLQKMPLSEADAALLRNFVNGKQSVLSDEEAKQLQLLLRTSEEHIPQALRLAAARQNLPDLPKLWAFVQLCNMTRLLNLSANRLRSASRQVGSFTSMLKRSMQNENEATGAQRSMSFMTPLYLGEEENYYPTYVHIYDETSEGDKEGEERRETWLRLCMLTENIGAVEIVFRLYEQKNLNLRVFFSEPEAVENFSGYVPELKQSFEELPLVLTDIKVGAIGE